MTGRSGYPFPAELAALPRDRAAVIEASAGTGKTYLIEHLVVDRLVRGDARIDEILVVTFTERAAAELVRRIRALIRRRAPARAAGDDAARAARLDDRRRRARAAGGRDARPRRRADLDDPRVLPARADRARVRERPAAGAEPGREPDRVHRRVRRGHSRAARGRRARRRCSAAWLASGQRRRPRWRRCSTRRASLRCDWAMTYDPERSPRAARAFAELPPSRTRARSSMRVDHTRDAQPSIVERLELLLRGRAPASSRTREPALAARRDRRRSSKRQGHVFEYLDPDRLGGARDKPGVARAAGGASRSWPTPRCRWRPRWRSASARSSRSACARASAPPASTTSTTCWRWSTEALRGPRGAELAAALRARFRLAIIDEFQDTDPVQWQIFRDDLPRRRRRRGRSTSSAIRSRRSTASAAPTSAPTTDARARRSGLGGVQLTLERNFRSTAGGHRRVQRDLRPERAAPRSSRRAIGYAPPRHATAARTARPVDPVARR